MTVFANDGRRYVYSAPFAEYDVDGTAREASRYFLTSISNEHGTTVATVSYAKPDAGGCRLDLLDSGVPYIARVDVVAGPSYEFRYTGLDRPDGGRECVLSRIDEMDLSSGIGGGTVETPYLAESYAYVSSGGSQRPGLLAEVASPGMTEVFAYDAGWMSMSANQTLAFSHAQTNGMTVTDDGEDRALSISYGGPQSSSGDPLACGKDFSRRVVADSKRGRGDGTTGSADFTKSYDVITDTTLGVPYTYAITDSCDAGVCSPGTQKWARACMPDGGADYEIGYQNKRGHWEAYTHEVSWDAGYRADELNRVRKGATDVEGTDSLEDVRYTYAYSGVDGRQFRVREDRDSVLGASSAYTLHNFDLTTGYLKSTIRGGNSKVFNADAGAWSSQARYIGTFYFQQKSSGCGGGGADPLGRTLEVHGPCFVDDDYDTDCVGSVFPITQYEYWGSGEASNRRNQLKSIKHYVGAGTTCSGATALTTTFNAYDRRGHATEIVDLNSITETISYATSDGGIGEQPTQRIVDVGGAGRTTNFTYENGLLVAKQTPLGHYEVYCYRAGSSVGSCTGGTWSSRLQWKAKATGSTGSGWTEAIEYTYWPDGKVKTESTRNAGGVRTTVKTSWDAEQRLTWSERGTSGSFVEKAQFDGANNRTALGLAANAPPDFCASNSTLCSWMAYDRANRLAQMDAHPDVNSSPTANSTRTCFEYDAQGNLKRVAAGCKGNGGEAACPINNSGSLQTDCGASATDYEYDDFGNVTAVTSPWTFEGGSRGVTRYAYDARGNVETIQSPEMRGAATTVHIKYTHDTLGRVTLAERAGASSPTMYALTYDDMTMPGGGSGCPAIARGYGRITRRSDSSGVTALSYDDEGRIIREVNVGTGTSCNGEDTTYGYDLNGNLVGIGYPHGRAVQYVHTLDRPTTIKYNRYNGSTWNAAYTPSTNTWSGTPTTVIENIAWEPYGGLRGYQVTDTGHWVEYYLGGSLETAPTATACSSLSATYASPDESGRLKGIFVSSSAASMGSPSGSIFKQVYTWNRDQLVAQHTCHRNGGAVVADAFAYDRTNRLLSFSTDGGAPNESFTYDLRGNRTVQTLTNPSCTVQNAMTQDAGWQLDLVRSTTWGAGFTPDAGACNGATSQYAYTYDRDGRQATKQQNGWYLWTTYPTASSLTGFETVMQSANVNGGTYSYWYDALGRRRAKLTPWSSVDYYFYDTGHQMLSDRGNDTIGSSPGELPQDDYIWLGGRPVVIIRAKFHATYGFRYADSYAGTDCNRDGIFQYCDVYFPVTDQIGKPVVMLNSSGATAGSARYSAFGSTRREARHASTHYANGSATVMTIAEDMPSGFDGYARVLFSRIEQHAASLNWEDIAASGDLGHVWSHAVYGTSTWVLDYTGTTSKYGFDMEGYELKLKQQSHTWFWTPLRFPGQYYDEETELHENWNRYYDATSGRYIQPEPWLQHSRYAEAMGYDGVNVPTYTYAFASPAHYIDPTGLGGLVPTPGTGGGTAGIDTFSSKCRANPLICALLYPNKDGENGQECKPKEPEPESCKETAERRRKELLETWYQLCPNKKTGVGLNYDCVKKLDTADMWCEEVRVCYGSIPDRYRNYCKGPAK